MLMVPNQHAQESRTICTPGTFSGLLTIALLDAELAMLRRRTGHGVDLQMRLKPDLRSLQALLVVVLGLVGYSVAIACHAMPGSCPLSCLPLVM